MRNVVSFLFLTFFMLMFVEPLEAQVLSERSVEVTVKNGEKFYVHTVKRKETLFSIAKLYDVTETDLMHNNSSIKRGKIKVGQKLLIPFVEEEPEDVALEDEVIDNKSLLENDCDMVFASPDSVYRVALMLPLFLEQVDSVFQNSPANNKLLTAKPFSFIHFYEGFMIAVDSLVTLRNLKLDLKVYDIDNNMMKLNDAMQDPWLKNADLIIGPFYIKPFEMMMGFAEKNGIMIVNPLTNRSNIVDNHPNVVKVKPSYSSQVGYVRNLVRESYSDNNVFIVKMKDKGDNAVVADLFNELKDILTPYSSVSNKKVLSRFKLISNKLDDKEKKEFDTLGMKIFSDGILFDYMKTGYFIEDSLIVANNDSLMFAKGDSLLLLNDDSLMFAKKDSMILVKKDSLIFTNNVYIVDYVDNMDAVTRYASVFRNNVVIIYTDNNVDATQLINKVNVLTERYPVSLICLPEWSKFDNLFSESLMSMSTVYLDDKFLNYSTIPIRGFVCKFRERYGTEPTDYAYYGFDIAWYFLNAIMRFGSDMSSCLPYYQIPLLTNDFIFMRDDVSDGLENVNWNMYRFENYEKVIISPIGDVDVE